MTDVVTVTEPAWDAWRNGCSVVPVRSDGSKTASVRWEEYQQRRPTEAEMTGWFGPATAAAVICGPVSGGLVMIEMEGDDYSAGQWQHFRDAAVDALGEERWQAVAACVEMSPSGGPHLLIRCVETIVGNLKLARRRTGPASVEVIMETRGAGGYTVIAGSVGHASGKPWSAAKGGYADIATVTGEELHLILDAARTLDEMPPPSIAPPPKQTKAPKRHDGDSVFDAVVADYNNRTTWAGVLVGFAEFAYDRGGTSYWHRIGSDNETGMTTNATGNDTLIVFSTSTMFDCYTGTGPAPSYDRFGAWAVLEHGGDRTEAMRALRDDGYGPDVPRPQPQVNPRPRVDPVTGEIDDGPLPLPNRLADLPPFPVHVLPDWMADEARAAADSLQVPIEMTAFLALMALSITVAGKVDVDAINWRQPLNIYGTVVSPTGTGKSPAVDRMLAPIRELERSLAASVAEEVAYSEAEATSHAAAVADAEKTLKGQPGSVTAISALADARATANEHRVLNAYRLTIDDHTPEALGQTIAGQPDERIAVVSPEGASLFESMAGKRYKDPSAVPNVPDVYLKAWGGEQVSVDRVGRPALIIERPILSVCVMVQPDIITALSASPMIARQGGLARFLWVSAADLVGTRDRRRRRTAAPQLETYRSNLIRIGLWAAGADKDANTYLATDEAADVVDDLADDRERRMAFGGDLEAHRAIEAKMLAYHWRLAGLLAVAYDDRGDLTAERTAQAAELVEYFMAHAVAVHAVAGLDEVGGAFRKLGGYLMAHAGETIDIRDMQLHFRSLDAFADLVVHLETYLALRWIAVTEGALTTLGVRGKPNPTITVDARLRANFHGAH